MLSIQQSLPLEPATVSRGVLPAKTEGIALKKRGMKQAEDHAGREWLDAAAAAFLRFRTDRPMAEFAMEDFREWSAGKLDAPPDHHIWGAFTNRMVRAGYIAFVRFEPARRARTRGHPVKVWRWVQN